MDLSSFMHGERSYTLITNNSGCSASVITNIKSFSGQLSLKDKIHFPTLETERSQGLAQ